jgi:hypothetical protein
LNSINSISSLNIYGRKIMAVKIDVPGIGEVTAENFAQEDTLLKILAAMSKSDKTKRAEEKAKAEATRKEEEARKKNTKAINEETTQLEKEIEAAKKQQKESSEMWKQFKGDAKEAGSTLLDGIGSISKTLAVTTASVFASMITTYDELARNPIEAGKGILQTTINLTTTVAKIGVDIMTSIGKAAVGWVPFIGGGLADIVGAFGALATQVIDFANQIATAANEVLAKEFEKRAKQLADFSSIAASFAGGMTEMASLANQSGVGIVNFTAAVLSSRDEITAMGESAGSATKLLAKGMGALGTTVGQGGKNVRDELMALGYNFQQQGKIMAASMAQIKALGTDLQSVSGSEIAVYTEQYAKNLKVLSDMTGQDAQKLLDQARAESQRGALMTQLTAKQSVAFQDAYAAMAALPGQQGPKLQAALSQLLAGGTITDPVIAGNQQIMAMLNKTAQQVGAGNVNMVTATQQNLAEAANAYRAAGDSATDFATLMNPGGTSAVAQGMSQFGNALRQYRYDPTAAEDSMTAAQQQASVSDGLTGVYVGLTDVMTTFQNRMEGIAGEALPAYSAAMMSATQMTFKVVNTGLDLLTGKIGIVQAIMQLTGMGGGGGASAGKANAMVPGLGQLLSGSGKVFTSTDTSSGAGASLATAQSSSVQAPTQGQAGSLEGTYSPPPPAPPSTATPSAASGGILEGSTAGFAATLHGTEAVVPLPGNRSIPVNLDSSSLTAAVHQQTGVLTQILSSMQKNNTLTSGILQASM